MTPARFRRLLKLTAVLCVIPLALTFAYAQRAGDFAGYVLVGELALRGRDIYDAPPNTWPPLFALFCIPLALLARLSLVGARVLWLLLNWAALLSALAIIMRFVHGRRLTLAARDSGDDSAIDVTSGHVLLPLVFCAYWIINHFEWLQVDILIFALTLFGLAQHQLGREARAGVFIGAAAALKVMPVLFVPYFAWRRQWRVAAFAAVFTAAWSLLPSVVYGWTAFTRQWAAWLAVVDAGWGVGRRNLSVFAMIDRIVGHGFVPLLDPAITHVQASGSSMVTYVAIGALVLVAAIGLWLFRGPYRPHERAAHAEWSVVFLVAALFGTVTWKHYLVVLLLPAALFVATWRDSRVPAPFAHRLQVVYWLAFAMSVATASDLTGRAVASRLEMASLPTMMALMILAALFWYRARFVPEPEAAPAPTRQ